MLFPELLPLNNLKCLEIYIPCAFVDEVKRCGSGGQRKGCGISRPIIAPTDENGSHGQHVPICEDLERALRLAAHGNGDPALRAVESIQLSEACSDLSAVYLLFVEMYNAFLKRVQMVRKDASVPRVVPDMKDYIETHITERISLEEMAGELGYTTYYLSKLFKKHTGLSVNTYIQMRRIENSKEYLRNPTLSIADISMIFQLSTPSYYCSQFKRFTNMTPMAYRDSLGSA